MKRTAFRGLVLAALMLLSGCTEPAETEPTIRTGWQALEGVQYYYLDDGSLATGWQDMADGRRYFGADGIMLTGWQEIAGKRYYFSASGAAASGWQQIGDRRYYFLKDHSMTTGENRIDGVVYSFGDDGSLLDGFVTAQDGKQKFYSQGIPAVGWFDAGEHRYYALDDGTLHTGWLEQGEYRYYFREDGTMAAGPCEIDGQVHYFTPKGIHVVLVNPWHSVPEYYDVDLVSINSYYQVDKACYTSLMQMMAACENAGHQPMVCSAYRTQEHQTRLFTRKVNYYLDLGESEENAKILAGQVVAVPGTSEHQLGLAVDIVSTDYYVLDESQEKTRTQQWLMEHCWEYGFILRYPNGSTDITGIIYEPWHYRYVGLEVSLALRDLGITLEEYLGAVEAVG